MKLEQFGRVAAAVATIALMATEVSADTTRWKLHSAFTQGTPVLGPPAHQIADFLETVSKGEFRVKVFEPGAIVGGGQYFDAVSQGSIDAAFGTPGYHVGKNSAFAFFASVPFGPSAGEYLGWMRHGGGTDLAEELYAQNNIKYVLCGIIPPETSGWFREEITSPEDLKGLKMRFFGLGAKVMEKLGVSTQLLAGADIYPALELGTIDAAEFSMPAIDRSKGFYQIAKHNYFPGWHQQSTTTELLINMDSWNALDEAKQAAIESACLATTAQMFAEGEAIQFEAMQENVASGAIIHRWSDEMLDTFEGAWSEVLREEIAQNEDSTRVYESYAAFRDGYKIWRENGYLD